MENFWKILHGVRIQFDVFLPLNLDWSVKSFSEGKHWNPGSFSEEKCQRKLKLNFEKKYNSLQMYFKIE